MTLHSALYTASCADIRLSGLNCNSFCSKSTACSLLERWRTCLNLSKSNQKKALIGPMQTLIVTVVFHTRHCFELHREMQTATCVSRLQNGQKMVQSGVKSGGTLYAVSVKVTLKSTQPTHTDAKMRKDPVKDAYTTCGNTDWGGEVLDSNHLLSHKLNLKPCSRSRRVSSSRAARERPSQIFVILAVHQRGPFQNRAVVVHG